MQFFIAIKVYSTIIIDIEVVSICLTIIVKIRNIIMYRTHHYVLLPNSKEVII